MKKSFERGIRGPQKGLNTSKGKQWKKTTLWKVLLSLEKANNGT